ncbi:MAG: hypothetical protein ACRDHZ_22935, partial [Ktedonobacteraceae bacterium]
MMHDQSSHLYLIEPAQLPELNNWVTTYQNSQQRFTFTEAEVLQTCWDQGEDILLREDSRFQVASLPDMPLPGRWQLRIH